VGEVVEKYKRGDPRRSLESEPRSTGDSTETEPGVFTRAIGNSLRQFAALLPVMVGVVLLVGLANAFVSKAVLASLLSGNAALDTLWGACFGSILAGNPINSYIIGGQLLEQGISLFAVTALMVTWVTVGVVQLPAEMAALGKRFAILRNAICFVAALPISILTVVIFNLATR
jgi:uncharacterized membrane protein YraQ (UPF0718 family)